MVNRLIRKNPGLHRLLKYRGLIHNLWLTITILENSKYVLLFELENHFSIRVSTLKLNSSSIGKPLVSEEYSFINLNQKQEDFYGLFTLPVNAINDK